MASRAAFETLRALAFGSIGVGFAKIGGPLLHPARIIKITNKTDAGMFLSIDGANDHDYIAAGGFVLYDLNANHNSNVQGFYFPQGTQFWISQESAPSSGSVYLTVIYGLANQP